LHDGRVIVSGIPEDVVNNDNVRRVYLGKDFNIQ
ncbi:LPS export ABC transporter ATP-binding protein, partial [Paracoccaceae bacterium]|nr:LPS export ABC transporter ATP-binding protein [Paracoccaceae bacterium]